MSFVLLMPLFWCQIILDLNCKFDVIKEQLDDMKDFFKTEIKAVFPNSIIKYVI